MSVLLIVSDIDGDALLSSPLARSLVEGADTRWTIDPTRGDIQATVRVAHDSTLPPDALAAVRAAFMDHPTIEAVLGDALVGGERQLRPAWSPTAIASTPADLDLVATRGTASGGTLADRIDALAPLPVESVAHLPAVIVERSHAERVDQRVHDALNRLSARRRTNPAPNAASVLIPTAGTRRADGSLLVEHAIDAARRCGLDTVEIIAVVGEEFDGDPEDLTAVDVRVVHRSGPWNFSAAINTGVLAATHDTVVLLNDDIEMLAPGWMTPLLGHLRDPEVSLVGAALLYPDHRVQHLGIVIDDALPLHTHVGVRLDQLSPRLQRPREVAAVTAACAVARRADLLRVGGLNEHLPANFNDVDLSFKLQREVGRIIVDPTAPLLHHESASRVPVIEPWEWEAFVGRWGEVADPWYHPGHHRPDDPTDRRRNADHLPPDDRTGSWDLRTPTIRPTVHRARLEAPAAESGDG